MYTCIRKYNLGLKDFTIKLTPENNRCILSVGKELILMHSHKPNILRLRLCFCGGWFTTKPAVVVMQRTASCAFAILYN